LHGTEDEFIPISSVKSLQKKMTSYGVRSELVLYDRQKHEFYNKNKYSETLLEVDKFLVSLGYLNNPAD
jgi:acetyl esterase